MKVIDERDSVSGARIVSHAMEGVSVVRIVGDVDLAVASRLRAAFDAALAAHPWIIVDLRRAEAVDSVGIGVLVAARHAARRGGGDLVLATMSPFFASVLNAARLGAFFTTFDTVPQAMTFALHTRS